MNNLSDEILNKYIDGELDFASLEHVNEVLSNSAEDRKRMQVLSAVHNELKKIKEDKVADSFTSYFMKKFLNRKKAAKEQRNFIFAISSVFVFIIFIIVGFIIYFGVNQPGESQISTNYSNFIIGLFQSLTSGIAKIFTTQGISIFGSIFRSGF